MAGAGVARDLAQRGLSCVLVEKVDFAAGTTSRSSKLIHGGLRYLELFDFRLVRESLRERETLARLAPHLIRPLPFLMPVYRDGPRSLIKVRLGLRLYDLLTPGKRTPRYGTVDAARARALEPGDPARRPRRARATTSTTCCSPRSGSASRTCCRRAGRARTSSTTPRRRSSSGARTAGGRRASGTSSAATSSTFTGASSSTPPGPGWIASGRGRASRTAASGSSGPPRARTCSCRASPSARSTWRPPTTGSCS